VKYSQKLVDLAGVLAGIRTSEEVMEFLDGILTPTEIDEISTRLQIVKMLKRGVSQRKIAQKLGISVATVSRGSKALKQGKFRIIENEHIRYK